MKDFKLQLDTPPQGVYLPGMNVTGTVFIVTDKEKDYKAVQVKLVGYSHVHWSQTEGSGQNRETVHFRSHEDYLTTSVQVWDKDTSAGGGQFPIGTFQFPFSLQLVGDNLPSSFQGTVGHIKYQVEARVVKDGVLKFDSKREEVIKVVNSVDINRPELLEPKSMEVQKTLCCLCCASGPIVIRATTPRTGYAIQKDSVPVTVSVENGSGRRVRRVTVSIFKLVHYKTRPERGEGIHSTRYNNNRYARVHLVRNQSEEVPAHSTRQLQLLPLDIPDTDPTLENCANIQVNYFLRVKTSVLWTLVKKIDIPLVLGKTWSEPEFGPPQEAAEPFMQHELHNHIEEPLLTEANDEV